MLPERLERKNTLVLLRRPQLVRMPVGLARLSPHARLDRLERKNALVRL